jgi:hypothetical protein
MIVTPQEFSDTIELEMRGHEREGYLTFYPASKIQSESMIPILENGGKTGVLIWNHGEGQIEAAALFNAPDGPQGAGIALLKRVIADYGVNYVEAFEPLNKIYESLGFHTESKDAWDEQYAPKGWPYEKFGTPSVHYMVRD